MFVILLRHAEREAGGTDPSLSAAGRRRAKLLADMLADSAIGAIFTSEFKRTKETVAPIAQRLGLSPVEIEDDITAAANQVRSASERVLVVGHSDTVPALISELGGPQVTIGDTAFDRFFVLHVAAAAADLVSMTYGPVQ
jgi:broad specificity phosphatase PhoE